MKKPSSEPCADLPDPQRLVRPLVRGLRPYVPGEQPRVRGLVKLNTNENPYPPSPKVLRAMREAVDERLRLYPPPTAGGLREKLAKLHGGQPGQVIVGNGSDELLALAVRTFVEPLTSGEGSASTVQFLNPSYSLYPVLAETHGARVSRVSLGEDFRLPAPEELGTAGWDFGAALTFITTPNAPSGRGYSTRDLEAICLCQRGVVILDEAYADFARENAMELALRWPHVIVARTFSKAYSLCFQRIGYFVGHQKLVSALDRMRDSYNVNGLAQVGALATLSDLPYYRRNFKKIVATREKVSKELAQLGFKVLPSQTNFILAEPPGFPAKEWLEQLRAYRILVRWFAYPEVSRFLRISIGTDAEMERLITVCQKILGRSGRFGKSVSDHRAT